MTNIQYKKITIHQDFFSLFQHIEKEYETCFYLESLGAYSELSRYSIIGFDPDKTIEARGNNITIHNKSNVVENPYYALRKHLPEQSQTRDYAGGFVGYLGYDAVNYFEPGIQVKLHPVFPQYMFGLYTDGFILDKRTDEIYYFSTGKDRSDVAYSIKDKQNSSLDVKLIGYSSTKKEHAEVVAYVKEQIVKGNTFQCQVGFKTEFEIHGDTIEIFRRLRVVNPSPFMYYLKFGKKKIIGASPELLFSLKNREMETYPLAGTIRRGSDRTEDKLLAQNLLHDPKEIAEHNMLVDLHRNDIGRVAEFGSVRIRSLMDIKKFSHVQHISSEITGTLRKDHDMFSALASNFPAGTLTGAPKIESMKIIDTIEKEGRGPYGGGVGHFGLNGDCRFAIAIRSLFISDSYAYSQTSGGIVYDSDPEKEYEEIIRKSQAMKEVLGV